MVARSDSVLTKQLLTVLIPMAIVLGVVQFVAPEPPDGPPPPVAQTSDPEEITVVAEQDPPAPREDPVDQPPPPGPADAEVAGDASRDTPSSSSEEKPEYTTGPAKIWIGSATPSGEVGAAKLTHRKHQKMFTCKKCHHEMQPKVSPTPCRDCHGPMEGVLGEKESFHKSCKSCHRSMGVEPVKNCWGCHKKPAPKPEDQPTE